ncbi:dynamin family protein [Blastococcus sp. Marseille-P5729]|uniref:dynamin family protein n=1 Tax=Blastococcus sp. Marseille-P5729 TaxID=2086582 RepID=UPI000D1006CC|nr:dynamin family protein [Blastococcus sp. Marseille-P5729]
MTQPQQRGGAPAKRITLSQLARQTADRGLAGLDKHDPEMASRLSRMRATRPDKPTVVVVGEAKRGKSSLTNALINVSGLSPVDARVATSTYIMFRRGPKTAARALLPGQQEPVDVPLDSMRDWATDLGNRGQYAPPRLIEVECDSPLLGKLNIVDTPGVGGLDATHAEIALRAVGRATALLFVCDASAPFTKPELDFLDKASKNIDLVIFAVTKTDAYRGWRQIVEDNRKLLREHAPRFADSVMLPVSAKLFEQAALMGPSDLGQALRKESNVTQLQIALQQQVAVKASALHEANLLRTMRSQLEGLLTSLEDSRRACQPDLEYANRLKENRDRLLQARKADSRAWQLRLRSLLSRARLDTMADIQSENRKFLAYWRRQIEEVDKGHLAHIGPQLDMALKASSMQIFDRQQARMRGVSRSVLQSMFAQNELAEVYAALQRPRQVASAAGPAKRQSSADEKVLTNISMMSGISITSITGSTLTYATGAAIVAWPIAVAVGLSVAGWIVWARRTASDRNQLKVWLNETLGETRARLEADASAYFIEAEHELTLALDRALVRRIETLDGHIKQIDQSLKVDRGERERRAAEITKQIAAVRDVVGTIDQLLPRLRNAVVQRRDPNRPPAPPRPEGAPQDQAARPAESRPLPPVPQQVPARQPAPPADQAPPPAARQPAPSADQAPPPAARQPAPSADQAAPAKPARAPQSVAEMARAASARLAARRAAERDPGSGTPATDPPPDPEPGPAPGAPAVPATPAGPSAPRSSPPTSAQFGAGPATSMPVQFGKFPDDPPSE